MADDTIKVYANDNDRWTDIEPSTIHARPRTGKITRVLMEADEIKGKRIRIKWKVMLHDRLAWELGMKVKFWLVEMKVKLRSSHDANCKWEALHRELGVEDGKYDPMGLIGMTASLPLYVEDGFIMVDEEQWLHPDFETNVQMPASRAGNPYVRRSSHE